VREWLQARAKLLIRTAEGHFKQLGEGKKMDRERQDVGLSYGPSRFQASRLV